MCVEVTELGNKGSVEHLDPRPSDAHLAYSDCAVTKVYSRPIPKRAYERARSVPSGF